MSFALGEWTKPYHSNPFVVGVRTSGGHFELTDFNATTGSQLADYGISWASALVYMKNWTSGSATVGPVFELQVAYDSGFTSQLRTIAQSTALRNGNPQTVILRGPVPDLQTLTYVRIAVTKLLGDNFTADAIIDVIP